ncbi:MAG: ABC transporter ATP-binding protein [Candidatus Tectimicrobiota bacterium]|nr:MAG: ABC transporter ATP-binding protein [Candidatus Tectomicrobia bacterium]
MALLTLRNVSKRFGGLVAVDAVSLEVHAGDVLGIIGPNGSGKTTLMNCISGIYRPEAGEIVFCGRRLNGLRPHQIARLGMARTFQVTRIFRQLTVLQNMLAPVLHLAQPDALLQERARHWLAFVDLLEMQDSLGMELSGGQQKLLEFARALMGEPQLVLMDEPFAGVHPVLKEKLIGCILELHRQGKTFVVISHDMASTFRLCNRIVVLSSGAKLAEGPPQAIQHDRQVIDLYLGV